MHTTLAKLAGPALVAVAVIAAGSSSAAAQPAKVVGRYDVKYEAVTSNCDNTGMALARGKITIGKRRSGIEVDIERIPLMVGTASKTGRIKATSKLGPTSIQGLDGKFSVAGTINSDGVMQVVFVAEYYLKNKPYCTQSWNVAGLRAVDEPEAPKADKKSADQPPAGLSMFAVDGLADPTRMRLLD